MLVDKLTFSLTSEKTSLTQLCERDDEMVPVWPCQGAVWYDEWSELMSCVLRPALVELTPAAASFLLVFFEWGRQKV